MVAQNKYELVAHLMPDETDTMNRILQLFARYELCTDPAFYKMLNKSTKKIRRKNKSRKKGRKRRTKKSRKKHKGKGGKSSMLVTD